MFNFCTQLSPPRSSKPPLLLGLRSSKWFILAVATMALFSEMFLYAIIVPVMPFAITTRAGVPPEDAQYWVSVLLAIYGAALFFGSPPAGWLADRTASRQPPFLLGLVALTVGSLLLCFGTSLPVLIVGRLLQGFASAVVWVIGFALLADTFGTRDAGLSVGVAVLGWTVATLVGPVLGGVAYAKAGYFAVFYMAFGLIALDAVLRLAMIERKVAARWLETENEHEEDRPNHQVDIDPEKTLPQTGSAQTQEVPCTPQSATPFSTSRGSTPAEEPPRPQSRSPMLSLLRSPRMLVMLWAAFVEAVSITAFDGTLPLHVAAVFGWTSTGAGLIFLALVLPSFLAPLAGRLMDRTGTGRETAAASFSLACPVLVLLRLVDVNVPVAGSAPGGTGQAGLLCALLAVAGLALTVVLVPVMAELTHVVDAREKAQPGVFGPRGAYARAYGLLNMCWAAGAVVGPIVAGMIVQSAGWGTMTWVLGLLNGVTAMPILLLSWQERRRRRVVTDSSDDTLAT